MAWVSRTPRGELFGEPSNVHIGPGSYEANPSSIKKQGVNYAPFTSTSHRSVTDVAPAATGVPAPGHYDPKLVTKYTGGALAQPFLSQTPRFTQVSNETPGPGSYSSASAIDVSRPKPLPRKHTRGSVEFVRVPTVPSIPSHRFQYGFHEQDGLLVAQGPVTEPIPTGPYVPPSSVTTAKGVSFAKSVGARDVFGAVLAKQRIKPRTAPSIPKMLNVRSIDSPAEAVIPGPGQYNVEDFHSIGGLNSRVAGNKVVGSGGAAYLRYKPSAVFLSKHGHGDVHQPEQRMFSPASIPYKTNNGLGDDEPQRVEPFTPPSAFDKAAQPLPPSKQCFLSRAPRKTALAPDNYTPGVGTYEVSSLSSFPLQDSAAVLTSTEPAAAATSSAFRNTVPRFQEAQETSTPGPGAYGVADPRATNKKRYSRNATFGSTSSRFAQPGAGTTSDNPLLGPGTYRPERASDLSRIAEKTEPTGIAFSTRTTRVAYHGTESPRRHVVSTVDPNAAFRIPGYGFFGTRLPGTTARQDAENGPCVGSYDLDIDGRRRAEQKGQRVRHFLSRSQRFETNEEIKNALISSHLAPGRYSPQHDAVHKKSKAITSSFRSSSTRFGAQDSFAVTQSDTPGPGAYDSSPPPLVRKTYNITIN